MQTAICNTDELRHTPNQSNHDDVPEISGALTRPNELRALCIDLVGSRQRLWRFEGMLPLSELGLWGNEELNHSPREHHSDSAC